MEVPGIERAGAIPFDWRRGQVERADLDRFLFAPDDIIVVVGQDGLVANAAKYLAGQPVIGIDPDPARNPGVLVPHSPDAAGALLAVAASGDLGRHVQARAMVEARTDDGQTLTALNEIFLGHSSHQSARYRIQPPGRRVERPVVLRHLGRNGHGEHRMVSVGVAGARERPPTPAA